MISLERAANPDPYTDIEYTKKHVLKCGCGCLSFQLISNPVSGEGYKRIVMCANCEKLLDTVNFDAYTKIIIPDHRYITMYDILMLYPDTHDCQQDLKPDARWDYLGQLVKEEEERKRDEVFDEWGNKR